MKRIIVNNGRGYGRVYSEMEKLNIEVFELEQKYKSILQDNEKLKSENIKTKIYIGMYYKKVKELDRIKKLLNALYENSNDYVRCEIKKIVEEMEGIKYD